MTHARFRSFSLTTTLVLGLSGSMVSADTTVTLPSIKDNTLFEDVNGQLSSGAGQYIFAGNTSSSNARRGLLQFDLTGIPASAQIVSATLDINVSRTARSALPHGESARRRTARKHSSAARLANPSHASA